MARVGQEGGLQQSQASHSRRPQRPRSGAGLPLPDLARWLLSLCPEGALWVDVEAFEGAARAAGRTKEPSAYEAALDLYAGELLPEDRYEG